MAGRDRSSAIAMNGIASMWSTEVQQRHESTGKSTTGSHCSMLTESSTVIGNVGARGLSAVRNSNGGSMIGSSNIVPRCMMETRRSDHEIHGLKVRRNGNPKRMG